MIPKTLHYCWFGKGEMNDTIKKCMETWYKILPEYEFKLWNEDNFDVECNGYCKKAYEAKKYALVSDYARIKALYEEGGLYLDTDIQVLKPFDDLLDMKYMLPNEHMKILAIEVMAFEPKIGFLKETIDRIDKRREDSYITPIVPYLDMPLNIKRNMMDTKNDFIDNEGIINIFKDNIIMGEIYDYQKYPNIYCIHHNLKSWKNKK